MSSVQFHNVSRTFPEGGGIREFTCDIAQGEFFALLGPSGCGKTTTLRIAAGLETPDSGTVSFDGRDVTHLAPERRNAAMVFQSYALFPHMNVFENVAFGLRARKMPKPEIASRVEESLELVQLAGMGKRDVTELSGGQQQRVALARRRVRRILLFDDLSKFSTRIATARGSNWGLQARWVSGHIRHARSGRGPRAGPPHRRPQRRHMPSNRLAPRNPAYARDAVRADISRTPA